MINFADLKKRERRKTIQCVQSKGSPKVESAERKHRQWRAASCTQGRRRRRRRRRTGPSREERGGGEGKRGERELFPSGRAGGYREAEDETGAAMEIAVAGLVDEASPWVPLTRRGEEIKKCIAAFGCDNLPRRAFRIRPCHLYNYLVLKAGGGIWAVRHVPVNLNFQLQPYEMNG